MTGNALLRQLLCHDGIVGTGDHGGGLGAHITGLNAQALRDAAEYRKIQPGLAFDHGGIVLLEVGREGGRADDVGAAVVVDDVVKLCRALLHQPLPHLEGHQTLFLGYDEEVQKIGSPGGGFHQILVPQGEGVRIHDESADFGCRRHFPAARQGSQLGLGFLLQALEIGLKAGALVLHEDDLPLNPGDLREAEAAEELGGIALCVQEEVVVSPGILILDEVGNDVVHQGFSLVAAVHGHAAQGVAEAAAGGDDLVIVIQHGSGIVKVRVPADALLDEQIVHPLPKIAVVGQN